MGQQFGQGSTRWFFRSGMDFLVCLSSLVSSQAAWLWADDGLSAGATCFVILQRASLGLVTWQLDRVPRDQSVAALGSPLAWCHLCCILLVKAIHKAAPVDLKPRRNEHEKMKTSKFLGRRVFGGGDLVGRTGLGFLLKLCVRNKETEFWN